MAYRRQSPGDPLPVLQKGPDGRRRLTMPTRAARRLPLVVPEDPRQAALVRALYDAVHWHAATPAETHAALLLMLGQVEPFATPESEDPNGDVE
ncbi:MAG: hypothetical protein FJX77_00020 [Armatimonadetes bacterium]|nr:hypothetical protein [Armatimonadota bacterium]